MHNRALPVGDNGVKCTFHVLMLNQIGLISVGIDKGGNGYYLSAGGGGEVRGIFHKFGIFF